jgi:hypothetical protein
MKGNRSARGSPSSFPPGTRVPHFETVAGLPSGRELMVQLQICKIRIMEEAGLSNSVLRETKRQFCHSRIDTTARYLAVSPATIGKTASVFNSSPT